MPAVYSIDLIAKRDRKRKMDSSIVKGWNVHYQTLEEVEQAARLKKQEMEARKREERAQENEEEPAWEEETSAEEQARQLKEDLQDTEEAYNVKTRSYSGHYGKKPLQDEEKKQQVHAILNEKPDAFSSALSAIQSQNGQA